MVRLAVLGMGLAVALWGQGTAGPAWVPAGPAGLQSASGTALASPLAALAIPPGAPAGTVLAGGDGGVWELSGGAWRALSDGQPVSALAYSSDGTALYAATGDANSNPARGGTGILKSGDGGATWTTVGAAEFSGLAVTRIAPDASSPQHLLVAAVATPASTAAAPPGLYASTDAGATWTQLLGGNIWDVAWSGSQVLAVGATTLALSTDGGQSFAAISPAGLPASWQRAVACAGNGGGFLVLFAGAGTQPAAALLALSPDGSTATSLPSPASPFSAGASGMAVATDAAGDIWLGGADLSEFIAAQGTWSNLTASLGLPTQQHAVLLLPDGSGWLANDVGLWRLLPSGIPQDANAGLANLGLLAYVPTAAGGLIALDAEGVAIGALSAGATWSVSATPASLDLLIADPSDATGQSGFGATGDQLWRWTSSGATWAQLAAPPVSAAISALAAAPTALWLGSESGQLLVSNDGGQSWTALPSPAGAGPISALAAASSNPQQIWMASGNTVFDSGNGGAAWSQAAALAAPVTSLALDPVHTAVVAAASVSGVSISLNSGSTWSALNTGLSAAPVTGLVFSSDETLWAATLGRGLWSLAVANADATLSLTANPATVPVGATVTLQAQATALDSPLSGVQVSFAASVNGTSNWSATAVTDASGSAVVQYTAPTTAGEVQVSASVNSPIASAPATIVIDATAGPPSAIAIVSGTKQSQTEGQVLAQPIVLQVTDANNNPIPNVTLELSASAGSFVSPPSTTDAHGEMTLTFRLPAAVGPVTLSATADGISQSWTETALPPRDYTLTLTAPSAAIAPGQNATLTLQLASINGFSQTVAVICSAPTPGCSVSPASLTPGQSATVTVNSGALGLNQPTVPVQVVSGDGTHSSSATLTLQAFTLTASADTLSAAAGVASSPITITVAPINGLTGPVTLAVTMADGDPFPASMAPLFQPASLMLPADGTAVTTQFSVAVAANSGSLPLAALALSLGIIALGTGRRRRRLRWLKAGWLGLIGAAALAAVACSSNAAVVTDPAVAPSTTTYPLVIMAQASGLQASVPVTLTVN